MTTKQDAYSIGKGTRIGILSALIVLLVVAGTAAVTGTAAAEHDPNSTALDDFEDGDLSEYDFYELNKEDGNNYPSPAVAPTDHFAAQTGDTATHGDYYLQKTSNTQGILLEKDFANGPSTGDVFQVDVVTGGIQGLVFGVQDNNNFYVVRVNRPTDNLQFFKWDEGSFQFGGQEPVPGGVGTGEQFTIRVVWEENQYTGQLYAGNGTLLVESTKTSDSSVCCEFTSGGYGMMVAGDSSSAFDNFRINPGAASDETDSGAGQFTVTDLSAPKLAEPGGQITVNATVTNVGEETAEVDVGWALGPEAGGGPFGTQTYTLDPGESTEYQLQPFLGEDEEIGSVLTHGIKAGDAYASTQTVFVASSGPPQFGVYFGEGPDFVSPESTTDVSAEVINVGGSAGSVTVGWALGPDAGGGPFGTQTYDLGPRESVIYELSPFLGADLTPGETFQHGILAVENDSYFQFNSPVVSTGGPNVTVESIDAPSTATPGDQITVNATIANYGNETTTVTVGWNVFREEVTEGPFETQNYTLAPGERATYSISPFVSEDEELGSTLTHGITAGDAVARRDLQLTSNAPRFTVTNLSSPKFGVPGNQITVNATVTNVGEAAGSVTVGWALGPEGQGGPFETETYDLAPGESTEYQLQPFLGADEPVGDVLIHGVKAGDAYTSTQTVFVASSGPPQFGVYFGEAPDVVSPETQINVSAEVINVGGSAGSVEVGWALGPEGNGGPFATQTYDLGPRESVIYELAPGLGPELTPGDIFQHGILAVENDSYFRFDSRVVSTGGPNVTVESIDAPSTATPGDQITVNATIANYGNETTTVTVGWNVFREDTTEGPFETQNYTLAPGEQATYSISPFISEDEELGSILTHGITAGDAVATRELEISEGAPEFEVSNLSAPAAADPGEQITVTATITNVGDAQGTVTAGWAVFRENVTEGPFQTQDYTLAPGESAEYAISPVISQEEELGSTLTHGIVAGDAEARADLQIGGTESQFVVNNVTAPDSAAPGEQITVSGTIENVGNTEGTVTVGWIVGDPIGDDTIGGLFETQEYTLAPGETAEYSISPVISESEEPGSTLIHGISAGMVGQPGEEEGTRNTSGVFEESDSWMLAALQIEGAEPTDTPMPTDTPTPTEGMTPTDEPTPPDEMTPTVEPTPTEGMTPTDTETSTDGGLPGFGIGVALTALVVLTLLAVRRR